VLLHAGYEPRGLFNVCEFVMNDKESSGSISLEEALQIMYLRHGRAELDAKLEEVFGTSDLNSGKTLSLTEFLSCLHQHQVGALLACWVCAPIQQPAVAHRTFGMRTATLISCQRPPSVHVTSVRSRIAPTSRVSKVRDCGCDCGVLASQLPASSCVAA
jgi:hypothetical protein